MTTVQGWNSQSVVIRYCCFAVRTFVVKNIIAVVFSTLLLAAFSAGAAASCQKPTAPNLPNPDTAVTPEMVKAKRDVQAYLTAAEAYLECVKVVAKHNAMVDEMEQVADAFNAAVRAYKARMANA